jgi:integrase/recombinase XerD
MNYNQQKIMEIFKEYLTIKGHTKSTIHGMILTAQRFNVWLEKENIPCGDISYADVLSFIQTFKVQGIKQKTQNTYIASIKKYLDYLTEQGVMSSNPADHIKLHGANQRNLYSILSIEELESLYYKYPLAHVCRQQKAHEMAARQNRIITGLLVWQGLRTEDLCKLTVSDLRLREGKINIPGGRKTERRTLELRSHQIIDLMDFLYETRIEILNCTKESKQLFTGVAGSSGIYSVMKSIIRQLKKQQPKFKSVKQIRASVITHWIKQYNLRKVQYMAGHRYVSSTEKFKVNDIEGLQDEIQRYHPIN